MSALGGVSACVQDLTDPTRRLYFENLTGLALLRRKLPLLFLPYVSYRFVLLSVPRACAPTAVGYNGERERARPGI